MYFEFLDILYYSSKLIYCRSQSVQRKGPETYQFLVFEWWCTKCLFSLVLFKNLWGVCSCSHLC